MAPPDAMVLVAERLAVRKLATENHTELEIFLVGHARRLFLR
jgi:hypothetical protein